MSTVVIQQTYGDSVHAQAYMKTRTILHMVTTFGGTFLEAREHNRLPDLHPILHLLQDVVHMRFHAKINTGFILR